VFQFLLCTIIAGAIVENTTHGLQRDLRLSYEISKKSNVHVIAGTGFYVADVQNATTLAMSIEQMTDLMTKEILFGVDLPGDSLNVKCGFIGEVGSGWPIHDFEKKAIIAAAEVQSSIGCGVSFHPGRNHLAPFEIIRIYLEAGGKANKCVMSHLERECFAVHFQESA
jgi:phosphotriesterase-related protein